MKPDLHIVKSACFGLESLSHKDEFCGNKIMVLIYQIEQESFGMIHNKY